MKQEPGDSRFERMVADLQNLIDEQEQALYSAKVIKEARNPHNLGRMTAADAQAVVRGWCGDTMEIYLRLVESQIVEATFMTDGCGPSVACGSMLTRLVQGKTLEDAGNLQPADLLEALNGLPEDSAHCAELAVTTLRQALQIQRSADGDGDQPRVKASA